MAVRQDDVRIEKPCPVQLDPARAASGVRSWHCGHCDKAVHVLSNMTEPEARAFMIENTGKDICVTYAARKDGTIRFAPEAVPVVAPTLVPIAALHRRRAPSIAATATVGLALALAACAPHDNANIQRSSISVTDTPISTPTVPVVPTQPVAPVVEPDEQLVDGMMAFTPPPPPEPPPVAKAGWLRAMPIADEPCDAPKPKPVDEHMVRGRRAP